jgi:hypothetical protein
MRIAKLHFLYESVTAAGARCKNNADEASPTLLVVSIISYSLQYNYLNVHNHDCIYSSTVFVSTQVGATYKWLIATMLGEYSCA